MNRSLAPELPVALVKHEHTSLLGISVIFVLCCISFATKLIARHGLSPNELADPYRLILQIEWAAILIASVIAVTLYLDHLPLSAIGIRRLSRGDILTAFFFLIAGTIIQTCLQPVLALSGLSIIRIRIWDLPPILDWISIVAAALGEEVVFRGYLFQRAEALTGSTRVAIVSSSLLFGLWHLPIWGVRGIFLPTIWGSLLAVFYARRRNLVACMLTHFLSDALATGEIAFSVWPARWGYLEFGIYFRVFRH